MRTSPDLRRGAFIRSKPNGSRRLSGDSEELWADRMASRRRRILPRCALSTVDCGIDAHSGFDG